MPEDHAADRPVNAPSIEPLAVSPKQAAPILGVGRTLLYDLLRSGAIPSAKIGARTLIRVDDLRAYLDRQIGGEAA